MMNNQSSSQESQIQYLFLLLSLNISRVRKKDEMYGTISNDRIRASVILLTSSSDLKACYREICIIFHIITYGAKITAC